MSSQRSATLARRLRRNVEEALMNHGTSSAQGHKAVSSLGQSKVFSSSSTQGQNVSRRWLHSLGLLRPGTADYAITRTALDRFGTSRRGNHEIARKVGSGGAQRAFLQNVGTRRAFSSENPKKKGFENLYPKNRKDLPKGRNEQKSEQKGERNPKQEGEKFFTETSKSQMQSLLATGTATVAILTTLSMGWSDAQQLISF